MTLFIQILQATFQLKTNTHYSTGEILTKLEFSEQIFEK
jgi:hypothetical protein